MLKEQFIPNYSSGHTGTETLFLHITGRYPAQDIAEKELPRLLLYLRQVNKAPRASEPLIRFYGIGCSPASIEDLAKEYGIRTCDVKKSITIARRGIWNWRNIFFELYGVPEGINTEGSLQEKRTISVDTPIQIIDLGFSALVYNALTCIGITTLGDLLRNQAHLSQELSKTSYQNKERQVLHEVRVVLARLDLLL